MQFITRNLLKYTVYAIVVLIKRWKKSEIIYPNHSP